MKKSFTISLIGRPNVGKSSLFNRLMKNQTKAITLDRPGVTRDRHYGIAKLDEHIKLAPLEAVLIDTGGFYPQKIVEDHSFFNIMADSAKLAIEESDLILLVMDVREGLLPADQAIIQFMREQSVPFWPVLNKFDSTQCEGLEADFYQAGLESDPFMVSAAHGYGVTELIEKIQEFAQDNARDSLEHHLQKGVVPEKTLVGRVALIGAPNVGKSTLLNRLVEAERSLVSDRAGTTVDPIEGFIQLNFGHEASNLEAPTTMGVENLAIIEQYERLFSSENEEDEQEDEGPTGTDHWRSLQIVDTAGIRRKAFIEDKVEEQSVYRSLRCMAEADIVLFLANAVDGLTHQDRRLIGVALEKGKSVIVLLNKFDLLKEQLKDRKVRLEWLADLRAKTPWLQFCELIPFSAKEGFNIHVLKKTLVRTLKTRRQNLSTSKLNQVLGNLLEQHPIYPSGGRGRPLKLRYASLVKRDPPTVLMFTNLSDGISDTYKRYLTNGLRKAFPLKNTPVHLIFRTKKDLEKRAKHYDREEMR